MSVEVVNGPIPDDFLKDASKRLNSLIFEEDQLLLPHEFEYIDVKGVDDAFTVIKLMQVRGAPLIAVVGCLGLLVDVDSYEGTDSEGFATWLSAKIDYLISSRPTAVDLRNALDAVRPIFDDRLAVFKEKVKVELLSVYQKEGEQNRQLVWNAYQELVATNAGKEKLNVVTICNTGSLATCSWGTALGVIRALDDQKKLNMVYALETRPYNQGIRLTASELLHGGVPFKVITDSMAAWLMKNVRIDAVLTGADNVSLNGDTANKIGTYMLAVLCRFHDVPFYPVVPRTSINTTQETGEHVVIEERPATELLKVNGKFVGPADAPVWNPAFDVTPAELVTKVLTDFGNFRPQDLKEAVRRLNS